MVAMMMMLMMMPTELTIKHVIKLQMLFGIFFFFKSTTDEIKYAS